MVWAVLGLVGAAVVFARLVARRGRRQTWWVCATAAPATLLAGSSCLAAAQTVNQTLATPNVAILLYGLCFTIGSACCQVFWHAVRTQTPSSRVILGQIGLATLVGSVTIVAWWAAPLHGRNYLSIQEAPITSQMVAASTIILTYWAAVAINSGVGALQVLRLTRSRRAGQAAALRLFVVAAVFAVMDDALFLAALDAQSRSQPNAPALLTAAKIVALLAAITYGLDSFMALVVPRLLARWLAGTYDSSPTSSGRSGPACANCGLRSCCPWAASSQADA